MVEFIYHHSNIARQSILSPKAQDLERMIARTSCYVGVSVFARLYLSLSLHLSLFVFRDTFLMLLHVFVGSFSRFFFMSLLSLSWFSLLFVVCLCLDVFHAVLRKPITICSLHNTMHSLLIARSNSPSASISISPAVTFTSLTAMSLA